MSEYIVETIDDIDNTIEFVINRLKKANVLTKEDLEEGTLSHIDIFSKSLLSEKSLKKTVTKVYNNTIKYVSKYNSVLKQGYEDIRMNGAVFYYNEGLDLDDLLDMPLHMSVYSVLSDFNESDVYNLDIDNYLVMYKLSEDVMGIAKFKVKGVNYIHCFTVCLTEEDDVISIILAGNNESTNGLGLSSLLCDKAILCDCGNGAVCRQVFNLDVDCEHRKFFSLLSLVTKKTLNVCMPDDIRGSVLTLIKEAIVLRDNANIVTGKTYTTPALVSGTDGDIIVYGDDNNVCRLTRSN